MVQVNVPDVAGILAISLLAPRVREGLQVHAGRELPADQRPGVGPETAAEEDVDAEGLPNGATRSPTRIGAGEGPPQVPRSRRAAAGGRR